MNAFKTYEGYYPLCAVVCHPSVSPYELPEMSDIASIFRRRVALETYLELQGKGGDFG